MVNGLGYRAVVAQPRGHAENASEIRQWERVDIKQSSMKNNSYTEYSRAGSYRAKRAVLPVHSRS